MSILRSFKFVIFLWVFSSSALALAQAPTQQQIEALRALGPSERQALASQLGIEIPAASTPVSGSEQARSASGNPESEGVRSDQEADFERIERLRRELSFKPGDFLLIDIFEKPNEQGASISTELVEAHRRLASDVRAANPFRLDSSGALRIPGLPAIPLAGLSEQQAVARLASEPNLRAFSLKVTRLPVDLTGFESLKPFGYDIFDRTPSTFAPINDVPVPAGYVIGIGDELSIQLYGGQNKTLKLAVTSEGRLNFPELGPISVAGKTFDAVRQDIELRVSNQMPGSRASVSMTNTRSIRVFVVGESKKPGSYTVSGLSTITSALYASGGIKTSGSLRDIQLKRRGQVIQRFDLYDLLLRGDTQNDVSLLAGDVILVPPVGSTVAIDGEVRRPAIYELRGSATVKSLIALAGGVTEEADLERLSLLRITSDKRRIALGLSDVTEEGDNRYLRGGDKVSIPRLSPGLDSGIVLDGHVFQRRTVAWREGIRLTDIISSADQLRANADLHYVLIRRETMPDRSVSVLSTDLLTALKSPGSAADLMLAPRDRITVFDSASSRRAVIDSVLVELKRQAVLGAPSPVVSVAGRVKESGEYPLEADMRVSDLIRASGGLQDSAFSEKAELTRYRVDAGQRVSEILEINLSALLKGDSSADIVLEPFDALVVKEVPEWSQREYVTLRGEVRFPGTYPLRRGETLRSVLERAGGLTTLAFAKGAVFTRRDLIEREQKQIDDLASRLKSDLVSRAVQAGNLMEASGRVPSEGSSAAIADGLLNDLKNSKPTGRLVIDLDGVVSRALGSSRDVILRDGDELSVPKLRQEVTVIGEVQNATSHLFRSSFQRDDYIALSGGATPRADMSRAYIVRADGSVVPQKAGWLRQSKAMLIQPGDTIVVPLDTERLPQLGLWQAVSTIIYNSAVALAAIRNL